MFVSPYANSPHKGWQLLISTSTDMPRWWTICFRCGRGGNMPCELKKKKYTKHVLLCKQFNRSVGRTHTLHTYLSSFVIKRKTKACCTRSFRITSRTNCYKTNVLQLVCLYTNVYIHTPLSIYNYLNQPPPKVRQHARHVFERYVQTGWILCSMLPLSVCVSAFISHMLSFAHPARYRYTTRLVECVRRWLIVAACQVEQYIIVMFQMSFLEKCHRHFSMLTNISSLEQWMFQHTMRQPHSTWLLILSNWLWPPHTLFNHLVYVYSSSAPPHRSWLDVACY